jgi:hypothetical protein
MHVPPRLVNSMPIEDGGGETTTLYDPYDLMVSPPRMGEYNITLGHESADAKKNRSRTPSLTEAEDTDVPEAKRLFTRSRTTQVRASDKWALESTQGSQK